MPPKDYNALIQAEGDAAKAIVEAATKDGRDSLNDDEQGKVKEHLDNIKALTDERQKAKDSADLLKQLGDLPDLKAAADQANAQHDADRKSGRPAVERKTLGQLFVESDGYKALKERYPQGIPNGVKNVDVGIVNIGGMPIAVGLSGRKDLVFVGDNTGPSDSQIPAVPPDFRGILPPTFAPLSVRDLVSSGSTTSDVVEYVRENREARDLAAAPVPEARETDSSGDTDSIKPESTIKFERAEAAVRTIAHWIPVTKKALADVGQARSIIDLFLTRGLDEALEHQIVNGDGTGEDFLGLMNDPDIPVLPFSTDVFTTVRKAKTYLATIGVRATAILMSPEDDEAIDLAKDGMERFYGQGPFGLGPNTLWALPRVWSNEMPAGKALIGDFRTAVVYDREAATITTGTIDDQFIRNMLTILAEMRAAFAVHEPFKLLQLDLSLASS